MAVRVALGAGRGRLVRQLLAENFVVAVAGGLLGVLVAERASSWMVSLAGRAIARADQVQMDGRVLLFAAGATLLTGLLFGLVPALQGSFGTTHASLKDGSRGSEGRGVQRLRQVLVAAQVAISLVLLASAALLLRSLSALQRVDPGFQSAGVLTLRIDPTGERYLNDTTITQLYEVMLSRLAALPGVQHAAAVDILPMSGGFNGMGIRFLDRDPVPSSEDPSIETRGISPDFFGALGVPIRRGRAFTGADRLGAPTVAIVDETMANRFWPGDSPIGKRIVVFDGTEWEIVGVSGAVRQFTLDQVPAPTLYLPSPQVQRWTGASGIVLLRTTGDPISLATPAREAIASIDRTIPVSEVRPIRDVVGATLAAERLRTVLLGVFGAIAFVIAAVGMYGVVAYGVSRRTTEFGIRMALGARPSSIVQLVMRQSARPIVLGGILGLAIALIVGHALAGWLYGISPRDPIAYVAALTVIAGAAFIAAFVPARRATRVEPSAVLRSD
jgi:predicted permease